MIKGRLVALVEADFDYGGVTQQYGDVVRLEDSDESD